MRRRPRVRGPFRAIEASSGTSQNANFFDSSSTSCANGRFERSGINVKPRCEPIPGWPRPFLSVSDTSQKSREVVQCALDAAYKSRFGRSPEQIKSDLIARLGPLNLELDAGDIQGWVLEICEGRRIQIRMHGGLRR